jgi:flagellar hook-associated protein 2
MATNSISSSGQFINIDALVSNSVSSQKNRVNVIQNQKNAIDTKISGLGQAKSQLSGLFDKFQAVMKTSSAYNITGVASDAGLTVNATKSGNYQIQVEQLASHQIMTSGQFNASNTALGFSGKITIDKGSYDGSNSFSVGEAGTEIEIVATDTLKTIQDKMRATGQVNVSIINSGTGSHLGFSSVSAGAENAVKISVSDDNNTGLSQLAYSQGQAGGFKDVSRAQDGLATVNGIQISSKDNNFKGADGLSFIATKETEKQNVSVKQDNTSMIKAIEDFVSSYNTTSQSLKKNEGLDLQLKNFGTNLRSSLTDIDFNNGLSQMGLSFDKSGMMTFNKDKFNTIATKPEQLSSLLEKQFSKDSKAYQLFNRNLDSAGVVNSTTERLKEQSSKLQKNLLSVQDVLVQQQNMYRNKYAALDSYLSGLNDNSSRVGQLLDQFNNNKN